MEILHVIPYMHPNGGGPPVVVDRFCRELKTRGHQVSVLTTDALSPPESQAWTEQYHQHYDMTVLPAWRRKSFAYNRGLITKLDDLAKSVDLVHLHNLWSYMTLSVAKICQRRKIPFVVSPHGMLDPHSLSRKSFKKKWYGQLVEFPRIRQASRMIYTHLKEQQLAEQSCPGLPGGSIVPLGADNPPAQPEIETAQHELLNEFPELRGKQIILFLGRLHPKKGLDLLLPAMERIKLAAPSAHLVLSGPVDTSYQETLAGLLKQHSLQNVVTQTGPVFGRTKWGLFSLADVFVLPSYQENFAITVAEALSMKVPVVLSDRVNIWEEVVNSEAGLLCQLDPENIASTLLQVLLNKSLCEQLGKQGPVLIQRQFNWQVAGIELEKAYQSVLQA